MAIDRPNRVWCAAITCIPVQRDFPYLVAIMDRATRRVPAGRLSNTMDTFFIERPWRSLKYEAVYLHEPTDGFKAERVIAEWIDFSNTERPHSALGGRTPAAAQGAGQPVDRMG